MTIDEAIIHAENVASKCTINCFCAEEHRQLAEWLKELKHLRSLVSFAEYHNVSIKRAKEELLRHEVTE